MERSIAISVIGLELPLDAAQWLSGRGVNRLSVKLALQSQEIIRLAKKLSDA